jgi:SagB-type dehydrogenase family enzyme
VEGLGAGLFRYSPRDHALTRCAPRDQRHALFAASLEQGCVRHAGLDIVLAAVYERATDKYGPRGERYAWMEAGHAAQSACLQATALGLSSVVVGAFDDDRVKEVVRMAENESPLYIVSVGAASRSLT